MALHFRKKKNAGLSADTETDTVTVNEKTVAESELHNDHVQEDRVDVATEAEVHDLEFVQQAESASPEEVYADSAKRRKKTFARRIACFVLAEALLLALCVSAISRNDLQTRSLREVEMELTGKINLNTGTYTGDTEFGWFDGDGDYAFRSGTTYSGDWEDNQIAGVGELKIPSEGEYEGDFLASQKSGQGVFKWEDGTVYDGSWKNDEMSGQGVYKEPGGLQCSGTFKKNHFDTGTCTFKNDTGSYELTFKDGKISHAEIAYKDGTTYSGGCGDKGPEGTGTMIYKDGDQYKGGFESGKRSGTGVYSWTSGEKYDGGWAADAISGGGTYTFPSGASLEGEFESNSFVNGSYHVSNNFGDYTFVFTDGKPSKASITLKDGTKYAGEMNEKGLNGAAQISYSNGDKYDGQIVNGQKSGSGRYVWKNGASYDGNWSADTMDGRGTYFYPEDQTGYKLVGTFASGVPSGKCTYYTSASMSYETEWQNGQCVKVTE